jgi:hypothetical protein
VHDGVALPGLMGIDDVLNEEMSRKIEFMDVGRSQ